MNDLSPPGRPPRRGRRRGRGPLWALLALLLALLASWILGRRAADEAAGGPEELRLQLVSFDDAAPARRLDLEPPPSGAPAGAAATFVAVRDGSERRRGRPERGPASASGLVRDASGAAVAGAEIRAIRALDDSSWPGDRANPHLEAARTDADGRFSFSFESAGEELRLVLRDATGVFHAAPPMRIAPWAHTDLAPWTLESPRSHRLHLTLEGGRPETYAAEIRLRPRPPASRLGVAPVRLRGADGLGRWVGPHLRVTPRDGGEITLTGFAGDVWELVAVAREHAPRRLEIPSAPATGPLALHLPLSDLGDLEIAGGGGDPLAILLEDADGATWLLEPDPAGFTSMPRAFLASPSLRVLRPGALPYRPPPAETRSGRLDLPPMGRVQGPRDARADGLLLDFRRVGAEEVAREVDTALGFVPGPAGLLDRRLEPGTWRPRFEDAEGGVREGDPFVLRGGEIHRVEDVPADLSPRRLVLEFVTEEDDLPLGDVIVSLAAPGDDVEAPPAAPARVLARADADGRVTLEGLGPGSALFAAHAAGRRPRTVEVEIPEVEDAELVRRVPLAAARAELLVHARDGTGAALPGVSALLVDPFGNLARARADANGDLLFLESGPGPVALFLAEGAGSLPLDDWRWLATESGAGVFGLESGRRLERDWILPRPRSRVFRIRFRARPLPPVSASISLGPRDGALGPGLWPSYDLGAQTAGRLEVGPLFPGAYRAVARWGDRLAAVEFDLSNEDGAECVLDFEFPDP
ncbi:MAG: carboxypeptidase-like regulatory domain-containing protein [Planctomycetota bacterium]